MVMEHFRFQSIFDLKHTCILVHSAIVHCQPAAFELNPYMYSTIGSEIALEMILLFFLFPLFADKTIKLSHVKYM